MGVGGDSGVQPHSMDRVRGERRDTEEHTHTHRNVHANVAPTLWRPTLQKSAQSMFSIGGNEMGTAGRGHQIDVMTFFDKSRAKLYAPPPSPLFRPKDPFQGRGVGVYILRPHAADILYPPFIHPAPLEGYL